MLNIVGPKKHFLVLDSFRGLCACLVAMSHFKANSFIQGIPLFDKGALWVDFFFVLSGFVIASNYQEKLQNGYGLGKFMFLRFGRLYPLHLCVLLAFISVDLVQYFVRIDGAAVHAPFSAPGESLWTIMAHVFLIHSLGTTEHLVFNGPSWSVSVEFYMYLIFALIFIFSKKYLNIVLILTIIVSVFVLVSNNNDLFAKLDFGLFRGMYGFGIGVIIWMICNKKHDFIRGFLQNKIRVTLLEVVTFFAVLFYMNYYSYGFYSFFIPLFFAAIIIIFSFEEGLLSNFFKRKPFLFVGTLSYSIYMIHIFVSGKLFALPIRLLEVKTDINLTTEINGQEFYGNNLFQGSIIELGYLISVIIFSYISYKVIEDPFRKISRNIVLKYNTKYE